MSPRIQQQNWESYGVFQDQKYNFVCVVTNLSGRDVRSECEYLANPTRNAQNTLCVSLRKTNICKNPPAVLFSLWGKAHPSFLCEKSVCWQLCLCVTSSGRTGNTTEMAKLTQHNRKYQKSLILYILYFWFPNWKPNGKRVVTRYNGVFGRKRVFPGQLTASRVLRRPITGTRVRIKVCT